MTEIVTPNEVAKKTDGMTPASSPILDSKEGFRKGTPFKKKGRRVSAPSDRPKPEFDQKMVSIRRVTRVMGGGRRFSFSVAMLLGDRSGGVGFGMGKSPDTALAIQKAVRDARNNMLTIKRTDELSIPHETKAKYASSSVTIFPNGSKGLVAGSVVRDILDFAGIKNVTAKVLTRSRNPINNAKAVMEALAPFASKKVHKKVIPTLEGESKNNTK